MSAGDRGRPRGHAPRRPAPAPARHRRARAQAARPARAAAPLPRRASSLMFVALVVGTAASLAPAPLAKTAIDDGILKGDVADARPRRRRVPRQRAGRLGGDLRADLPRRLGRPARARRPAPADLPPPAGDAGRLLRAPPGGRADLAHDQRRRGARLARHRHRRHAVPGVADAHRVDRDPALPRRAARADHVPDLPGDGRRRRWPSASPAPTPTGARARRSARSPPTCRRRCRASASCAPSRQEPRHRAQLRRAQRGQPRREHVDGQPQRRLLPARRVRLGSVATVAHPAHRRRARSIDGDIEIGVLVGFIAALNGFFDPIGQLSQVYTTYQSGMAALDKIFELLDEQPELDRRARRDRARRASAARSASRTSRSRYSHRRTAPKLALERRRR